MLKMHYSTDNSDAPEKKEPEVTATRMSTRILFRKKLKAGISHRKKQLNAMKSCYGKKDRTPNIQMDNPSHKTMFLKLLGLVPISELNAQPDVNMSDMSNELTTSSSNSNSSCTSEADPTDYHDDLDLQVVLCPLDIPEIYYEITHKYLPGYFPDYGYFHSIYDINPFLESSSSDSGFKKFLSIMNPNQKSDNLSSSSSSICSTSTSCHPKPLPVAPIGRNIKKRQSITQSIRLQKMGRSQHMSSSKKKKSIQFNHKKFKSNSTFIRSFPNKKIIQKKIQSSDKSILTPKMVQLDSNLNDIQHNDCNYKDPDSLFAIKTRLEMLDTELDFV